MLVLTTREMTGNLNTSTDLYGGDDLDSGYKY